MGNDGTMSRAWLRAAAFAIALGIAASAPAQGMDPTLAESYVEARRLSNRDESDPATGPWLRDTLLPQFTQTFRRHYNACAAQIGGAAQPFSFVAAVGSDGGVLKLWSDRVPPVYACVRGRLLFERFAPPPRAPLYLTVHMRFVSPAPNPPAE